MAGYGYKTSIRTTDDYDNEGSMLERAPNTLYKRQFQTTRYSTGAKYAADSTPTTTVYKNGTDDTSTWTDLTMNTVGGKTGLYEINATVPATYVDGDEVHVYIEATVDSVTQAMLVDRFRVVYRAYVAGTVNDGAPTANSFTTDITGKGDDFYNDTRMYFVTGSLQGISRKVSDYTNAGVITVYPALPTAPADDDAFILVGFAP